MRALRFVRLALIGGSLVASCSGSGGTAPRATVLGADIPGQITIDAVVSYKSFEGGFYALDAADGRKFDPMNLPASYERDGMAVRFTGAVRNDMASFHMYGSIVQLTRIEPR